MTFDEAIGVKLDRDIKTGKKLSHSEKYGRAIELLGGLDIVAKYIPSPLEVLREKIKYDTAFNNTKMSEWDRASGFVCPPGDCKFIGGGIVPLYSKHGITSFSNSDGVCLLKEAARRLIEREEHK